MRTTIYGVKCLKHTFSHTPLTQGCLHKFLLASIRVIKFRKNSGEVWLVSLFFVSDSHFAKF